MGLPLHALTTNKEWRPVLGYFALLAVDADAAQSTTTGRLATLRLRRELIAAVHTINLRQSSPAFTNVIVRRCDLLINGRLASIAGRCANIFTFEAMPVAEREAHSSP